MEEREEHNLDEFVRPISSESRGPNLEDQGRMGAPSATDGSVAERGGTPRQRNTHYDQQRISSRPTSPPEQPIYNKPSNAAGNHNTAARRPHRRTSHFREEDEEHELTEMAAPAPVQTGDGSGQWRKDEQLEDRRNQMQINGATSGQRGGKQSHYVTQLYIVSYLIFFSIWGTLARQGLQWLTFYPGAPVVFSNLWANFAGTYLMGFFSEDRKLFREEWGDGGTSFANAAMRKKLDEEASEEFSKANAEHTKKKKTIPLFIGLTVGFCGSFTSFSTFIRDCFFAIANILPTPINHPNTSASETSTIPRNGGYSFMAVLAIVILTITVNLSALLFGAHCAIALESYTPTLPFRFLRRILDPTIVVLGFGCWLGAVFLAIFPPDRPGGPSSRGSPDNETWRGVAIFPIVFAPLGCLLRFYLSITLNGIVSSFPLGTFAANIFGSAVLAMGYDIQHVAFSNSLVGGGIVSCQILQGIEDGFCGTLTTVSTWVNEMKSLKTRHAYIYGSASVLSGIAIMVVIMGSVKWTVGFAEMTACTTPTS